MNEDAVDTTDIEVGGYIAVRRGNHFTIKGRGYDIGFLDLEGEVWVARRSALTVETAPGPVCSGPDPKSVLHEFLRREGYLKQV